MKRSHKQRRADKLAAPPPRPRPAAPDPRKVHYYGRHLDEMMREAERLDHSVSWVAQRAWLIARDRVRDMPTSTSPDELAPTPAAPPPASRPRVVKTRPRPTPSPQPAKPPPEPASIRQRRLAREWAAHLEATRATADP